MTRPLIDRSTFSVKSEPSSQLNDNFLYLKKKLYSLLLSLVLVIIFTSLNATNYYVSNSGNDSNSGTSESAPWRTLGKVNASTFKAGDQILFKRGDTWRGLLILPSGGSSGNHVIYGAYGTGNKPRILGSEIETTWTNVSGNIWVSTKTFTDPYALSYDGAIYFAEKDGSISWGRVKKTNTSACVVEYDWTWASNRIYIYSPTNPNTRYSGVEITQRNDCVNMNDRNYITLDGIEVAYAGFHGIGERWPEKNLTGLLVQNCHSHHHGVRGGAGYALEVWHSNSLIRNNEFHDSGRRNLSLNLYGNGATVSNIVIEHNRLYNSNHTTGLDIATDGTSSHSNITFRYNYVSDEIKSDIDNYEVYGSGWVYCAAEGVDNTVNGVYIYNNIFNGATNRGISLGETYGPNDVQIYNNVFTGVSQHITGTYHSFILIQGGADAVIKNNIFYNDVNVAENNTWYVIGSTSNAGKITLDNNLYYNTSASRLMIWYGTSYGVANWGSYRSVSGQDANSILGKNPLFVSKSDFHLQQTSPAINAGVNVGLTKDFEGNPIINTPDIGAYEWQTSISTPAKNTIENISICEGSSYNGWTTSGQYKRTLKAASGADSIVTTNLTVNPVYHVSENVSIIEGESYMGWTESGQYKRTLTTSEGCDSIVTTNLVVEKNVSPTFSEYRFEESSGATVIDSKSSNNGTIINEERRGVGITGKGLEFTGSGYINLGRCFGDNVRNAVTVSAWINPGATTGDYQAIIWHGGPGYETFTLYILPNTNEIGFSTFGTTPSWFSADANNLFDGNWHHLAATFNSPEKIIYLDGVAIAKLNVPGTIDSGQGYDLLIGSSIVSGSPTYLYDGLIDEVRIYNYALTSSEIGSVYNAVKTSAVKYFTEDISICEGSSYNGWTTSGQYKRTLKAASGADSIVTTNLTVNPVYHVSEDVIIVEGESYMGWSESGQYERTITAANGCDSIVTTDLVVQKNISPTFSEYRFEESSGATVIDSKSSNNGTIINEERRGVGITGKGLEFTGSGYINLGRCFGDNVRNAVTVSAWINPGATTGDYQAIIWHGGPGYETFTLYILPNTNEIGFSTFGTTPSWFSANANNLFDGNWHHLAATFNSPEKIIYLDGVAIAKLNVPGTIDSGQGYDLLIGSSIVSGSPTYLYDGLIDEVRIYNYALTSSEIGNQFNAVKTSAVKYFTEDISICEGSSYNGWTTSGQYKRTLKAASGADSIVTTNLTVNPVYHVSEDVSIIEGESYMGWSDEGIYERNLISSAGCDSVVVTNLIIEMVNVEQRSIHAISLVKGWNIISSYLMPSESNMESVMESLLNERRLIRVRTNHTIIMNVQLVVRNG
jgi:hypothetical protein